MNQSNIQKKFKCTDKIEREVCIISAIGIENAEMEDFLGNTSATQREPVQLLTNNHIYESEGVTKLTDPQAIEAGDHLTFDGLPIDTQGFAPMVLLVPHMRSQPGWKAVSFIQILNLLNKLQVVSYFNRRDTVEEFHKNYQADRKKHDSILKRELLKNNLNENSPKRARELSPQKLNEYHSPKQKNEGEINQIQAKKVDEKPAFKSLFLITTIQP